MASAGVFCKMPSKIRLNTIWIAGGIKENQKKIQNYLSSRYPHFKQTITHKIHKRSYGRVVVVVVVVVGVIVVVVVVGVVVVVVASV